MTEPKLVTRDNLPSRYAVEGFKHLVCDRDGFERIAKLRDEFVGKQENTAGVRRDLRVQLIELLKVLKHQGHLYRKDGVPLT